MKIIGHRGARGLAPENTLASLERALRAGVDEIEIDVRVTRDGIPVLNHDPYIHDVNGGKLHNTLIHRHTLTELRSYRPDLTTLDEAVTMIDKRVPLVVEVKPRVSTAEVITALRRYLDVGWQPEHFLLASFSQRTLQQLHTGLPEIEKIVSEHVSSLLAIYRANQLQARRLMFNKRNIWGWLIRALTRRGYHIIAYTVNDVQKAERWVTDGLYGIITDYPDHFIYRTEIATSTSSTTPISPQQPGIGQAKTHPHRSKQQRNRHSK